MAVSQKSQFGLDLLVAIWDAAVMARTQVNRDELVASPDVLPRLVTSGPIVESYAKILRLGPQDGSAMGYPVVFNDGETKWIADGLQRLSAMDLIGIVQPLVDLRQGTKADATWFASGANREHGRPMTKGQKRQAVDNLLRNPATAELSAHQLAAQVGVDHKFVIHRQALLEKKQRAKATIQTLPSSQVPPPHPDPPVVASADSDETCIDLAQLDRGVKPHGQARKAREAGEVGEVGERKSKRFAAKRKVVRKGVRAKAAESAGPVILPSAIERRADLVARIIGLLDGIGEWVEEVVRLGVLNAAELEQLRRGLDAMRMPVKQALRSAEEDLDRFSRMNTERGEAGVNDDA